MQKLGDIVSERAVSLCTVDEVVARLSSFDEKIITMLDRYEVFA